jgi:hypothetical protein
LTKAGLFFILEKVDFKKTGENDGFSNTILILFSNPSGGKRGTG